MKIFLRSFTLLVVLALGRPAFAQIFNVYGTLHNDEGVFVQQLSSGDIIIGGYSAGPPNGGHDVLAMRLSSTGNVIWNKYYNPGANTYLVGADMAPSQDVYMLASPCGVIKIDANGDTIWTKAYYESEPVYGEAIVATADGGFAILSDQVSVGPYLTKITRCDANGNILWSNVYCESWQSVDIAECSNGDMVAVCRGDLNETMLLRVNAAGNLVSLKSYSGQYDQRVFAVDVVGNDVVITGELWDNTLWQTYGFLCRINATGNIVWDKILQYGQELQPRDLNIQGSTITIIGDLDFPTCSEGFIVQVSVNGILQSQHAYSFNTDAFMKGVYCNSSGLVFVTGSISEAMSPVDSGSVMLLRVNPVTQTLCGQSNINIAMLNGSCTILSDNCMVYPTGYVMSWAYSISTGISMLNGCTVGIDESSEETIKVYPDPASDYLSVELPTSDNYTFILYDVKGSELKRQVMSATISRIDVVALQPSLYFYRIESGDDFIAAGRFIKE